MKRFTMMIRCFGVGVALVLACLTAGAAAQALGHGVLAHLASANVASFDARHNVQSVRLNPTRDLYLITASDGRTDQALLAEIETDPLAGRPELNAPVALINPSPANSNLDGGQSTASVLNGQSTASVLNGGQSTASVLNGGGGLLGGLLGGVVNGVVAPVVNLAGAVLNPLLGSVLNINIGISGTGSVITSTSTAVMNSTPAHYYGAVVPSGYVNQAMVGQIQAGSSAHSRSTGSGAVVALIDNGVDPYNPVLGPVLLGSAGYNFYDNSPNWSAYADLGDGVAGATSLDGGQSTASVLNGQSTASVLNGTPCAAEFGLPTTQLDQSTASVLNGGQSTASVLNGQSTASVLNGGQSTASVLNGGQSTASVLNEPPAAVALGNASSSAAALTELNQILACDPDFGHGTSVAGLIHLVAPQTMILPIKAFGPGGAADSAAIYQSITYAIDHHVTAMNLSFSATAASPDVEDAIAEAVGDGIVVVAASGNDGVAAAVYPADSTGVLGAGALDGTGSGFARASFSNYDPGVGLYVDVQVAAPGVNLFTTYPGGGQIWATVSGTSFSTPLVVGEAALLAQLSQSGSAANALIENTANPAVGGNAGGALGHGLINVLSAVESAAPAKKSRW